MTSNGTNTNVTDNYKKFTCIIKKTSVHYYLRVAGNIDNQTTNKRCKSALISITPTNFSTNKITKQKSAIVPINEIPRQQ